MSNQNQNHNQQNEGRKQQGSHGGQGSFKDNPERAREAGSKGGHARQGTQRMEREEDE